MNACLNYDRAEGFRASGVAVPSGTTLVVVAAVNPGITRFTTGTHLRDRAGFRLDSLIRYYHYISDTKIDMLAGEIPKPFWKRLATELKIDVKVVSVTLKEKASEETRYSKLALVERYLRDEAEIGGIFDVGDPSKFFWGKVAMQWGPYVHHALGDYTPDWPMVWFAGETEDAIIGLAGSRRHLIGETEWTVPDNVRRETPAFTSYSQAYSIVDALRAAETGNDESIELPKNMIRVVAQTTTDALGDGQRAGVPPVAVEFVARRLFEGDVAGKRVVLGSPLFVAET